MTALLTLVGIAGNTPAIEVGGGEPNRTRTEYRASTFDAAELAPVEEGAVSTEEFDEPTPIPRWLVIAVGGLVGAAALYYLSLQAASLRFRKPQVSIDPEPLSEEEQAEEIVQFTRDLIDELSDGDDPREAIQRAYHALESGFGSAELARRPAETPLGYLERALGRNRDVVDSLRSLTEMFELARFSSRPIDESMRQQALTALAEIRDSYQRHAPSRRR